VFSARSPFGRPCEDGKQKMICVQRRVLFERPCGDGK
jgi:hypothetical protein